MHTQTVASESRVRRFFSLFTRLRERTRASVWWPLLLRGALWVAAFLVLAHIGRSSLAHLESNALITPALASAQRTASQTMKSHTTAVEAQPEEGSGSRVVLAQVALNATAAKPCTSSTAKKTPAVTVDGKVILNLASSEDLQRLPSVGAKRAESILKLRARLGRFRRVRDLLRIRGIGARSLRRLIPLVVVDPPVVQQKPDKKKKDTHDAGRPDKS